MIETIIRVLLVVVFFAPFRSVLADTNYDALYITKSNIAEYQVNVEVVRGDLMFNSYAVTLDADKYINTTCRTELKEAMIQIGDSERVLMAFPVKVDPKGFLSYSFDVDKELILTSTITLLYGEGDKKSDCDINSGSPVVIELEDWVN